MVAVDIVFFNANSFILTSNDVFIEKFLFFKLKKTKVEVIAVKKADQSVYFVFNNLILSTIHLSTKFYTAA